LGDGGFATRHHRVPRLGRMFIARPAGGLWHFWALG
jgi:hypothetical protein